MALDDGHDASDWDVTGSAGGPYTVTMPAGTLAVGDNNLTGGTDPAVVVS